jgi:hypothetical protein
MLAGTLVLLASQALPDLALARDFASTQPKARVEYWQERQATIDAQVADAANLRAVKLVFVGDSITDFWLLGDDPWIPGRMHGRIFSAVRRIGECCLVHSVIVAA